jgi:hypothetical protein
MITFYSQRQAGWNTNATAIGISTSEVTALGTLISSAQTALSAQIASKQVAKDDTVTLHDSARALSAAGADLIRKIKAKAGQTGGDSVYALAQIPPPSTPSPVGPPGTPYQLKVELIPGGALTLTWKCDNPVGSQGTLYQIGRKVNGATEFDYVGGVGTRKFTDTTLPAGTNQVIYQIQGVRTTALGVAQEFIVSIGSGANGVMTASVVEPSTPPAAPKMAA